MKNKNNILVLGSGMVSRPGVRYLLECKHLSVTVASNEVEVARKLVEGCANGKAIFIDVNDSKAVAGLVEQHDIIISLLPWTFHAQIAQLCLQYKKDMVTASYVSPEMRKLNEAACENKLLFLNEIGVDPGIDHMSTMKVINKVRAGGGKVIHFYSFCGGLPAPDDNDNPFGYKFSWSPKGVLLACKRPARFLENGEVQEIDGKDLFRQYRLETIPGLTQAGEFEAYPNGDSVPYREVYGLAHAQTVMRGTYRYRGWCDTLRSMAALGLIDEEPAAYLPGVTYKEMMARLVGAGSAGDVLATAAGKLGLAKDDAIIGRLEWLGLFSDEPVPACNNPLDVLTQRMQEKLYYKDKQKDMLLMRHRFIVEYEDSRREQITSTMIDYGIPGGDTSMARTVSLPLAIAVRLLSEGKIALTGVQIPDKKEIYEPVLDELEKHNIKLTEKREPL